MATVSCYVEWSFGNVGIQFLAEEVGVVLTRVNTTLCGYRLANTVLEEENGKIVPSSDPNERERRNEMLAAIENFLMSTLERKSDLTIVLECLEYIRKL